MHNNHPPSLLPSLPPSLQVTTEKLEELKENLPRAGPKYRLGMYFDTIHEISEFEEIHIPEEGYSSHWETDTELDDELDNLLFARVTGDSASVICLDEAMDILELREHRKKLLEMQLQQREQQQQISRLSRYQHNTPAEEKSAAMSRGRRVSEGSSRFPVAGAQAEGITTFHSYPDVPPPLPPKNYRISHHSGSDGTYDLPDEPPFHERTNSQEHIYETLDDCKPGYDSPGQQEATCVSKGSDGGSNDSSAKPHSSVTLESDKSAGSANSVQKMTSHKNHSSYSKLRKSSYPSTSSGQDASQQQHRRKHSDSDCQRKKHQPERTDKVAPRQLPSVPTTAFKFTTLPTSMTHHNISSAAGPATTGNMAAPLSSSFSSSFRGTESKKAASPQSNSSPAPLIIKHKGKTYLIPVVETKQQRDKGNKRMSRNCVSSSALQKQQLHAVGVSLTRSNSAACTVAHTVSAPSNGGSRRHASPPSAGANDHAPPSHHGAKRRTKHSHNHNSSNSPQSPGHQQSSQSQQQQVQVVQQQQQQGTNPKHVTLYGVL